MYNNESYEDYIRSILGYPNYNSNNCCTNSYNANMTNYRNNEYEQTNQLEDCYPEIYKIIYPMVSKACDTNTRPVTPELIDELTDEIYSAIENDNTINVTINLTNEVQSMGNRSTSNSVKTENTRDVKENQREDRQFRNRNLQDLIRILLIRELLRRRRFPGNRPPFPPNRPPMRPPFPGGPGGGRPPMMPRSSYYSDINDLYE